MNLFAIPPMISCAAIFFTGLFVFIQRPKASVNRVFSIFCLSMVVWLFCFSAMYLSPDKQTALQWARIAIFGVVFIPVTEYHFILTLINRQKERRLLYCFYLVAAASLLLSQTRYVYKDVASYFWGYYPVAGQLYILYLLMFLGLFSYGVFLLYQAQKEAIANKQFRQALQYRYVMLAFAGGTTGLVDYIAKYEIAIYPFGYLAAVFLIILFAVAIVRHRLMDIRIVAKKTTVYSIVTAMLTGLFISIIYASNYLLGHYLDRFSIWVGVLAAFVVAIVFQPLRGSIQALVDKWFFKTKYDYRSTLKNLANISSSALGAEEIIDSTVKNIANALKADKATLFVYDREKVSYVVKQNGGIGN